MLLEQRNIRYLQEQFAQFGEQRQTVDTHVFVVGVDGYLNDGVAEAQHQRHSYRMTEEGGFRREVTGGVKVLELNIEMRPQWMRHQSGGFNIRPGKRT